MKKTCFVIATVFVLALAFGCVAWASDAPQAGTSTVGQSGYGVAGQVYNTGAPQTTILFVIGQKSYTVDGNVYNIDAAPFIENGRTLVPVRYLGDAIGATTNWDGTSNTVTLTMGNTVVALVIGANDITVNGQTSPLDVAPVIKDGRTYLPARSVAEAFGYTVSWDQATQTVTLMQE
jgi:hypothetical protein